MSKLTTISLSAHCIDPSHPDCGWRVEGQSAEDEARRHGGELKGGPIPPHATVTEGQP